MFSAPLLPGRGWTLLSPALALRSWLPVCHVILTPRATVLNRPGPLAAASAGLPERMLPQPRGRRPPAGDRWKTTTSLCTAPPCTPRPCLQSVPSLQDLKPLLGTRERPPPLPFSWDLPHLWGRGWVLGWMLWSCCGWLEPPSGLHPELLPASHPVEKQPCSRGTGFPCLL